MIHASRNVEGFELAVSIVRKNSLLSLYEILNEGFFCCDCGIYTVLSEQGRKLNEERLDVLTIHLFTNKRRHTEGVVVVVQMGNSHSIRPKYRLRKAKTHGFSSIRGRFMKQDSNRNSGWTEGTRLHMGAFLV